MPQLVTSDLEIFELSELAAQSCRAIDFRADAANANNAPISVPLSRVDMIGSNDLAKERVTELLERTAKLEFGSDARRDELFAHGLPRGAALDDELRAATFAALDELGVVRVQDAARLLRALRWFEAPLPTTILAERVAQLLRGKSAEKLRELLGARDDLSGVEERAALAEPLFTAPPAPSAEEPAAPAQMRNAYATLVASLGRRELERLVLDSLVSGSPITAEALAPAPPQPQRSFSLALDADDPCEHRICLERCDAWRLWASWRRRSSRSTQLPSSPSSITLMRTCALRRWRLWASSSGRPSRSTQLPSSPSSITPCRACALRRWRRLISWRRRPSRAARGRRRFQARGHR